MQIHNQQLLCCHETPIDARLLSQSTGTYGNCYGNTTHRCNILKLIVEPVFQSSDGNKTRETNQAHIAFASVFLVAFYPHNRDKRTRFTSCWADMTFTHRATSGVTLNMHMSKTRLTTLNPASSDSGELPTLYHTFLQVGNDLGKTKQIQTL